MALEKMGEFFDHRLDGYEEHQLTIIDKATLFYPYTASMLPMQSGAKVIDLGCGTGLELTEYFKLNADASVTGIDLATGMLNKLKEKFSNKSITLINTSYFEVNFGQEMYDAAVSVESLHHFTKEEKIPLYHRLHKALKQNGFFILTDYMIESDEEETYHFSELKRLKEEQGISDQEFYHYDTPLTKEHEKEALLAGGFCKVECLKEWGNTVTLKAYK